jgi:hypothetical protein
MLKAHRAKQPSRRGMICGCFNIQSDQVCIMCEGALAIMYTLRPRNPA